MFLQQVNKHSKALLLLMVIFTMGQLFINYKHGMVASPFLSYGMYSEVLKVKNNYDIFEVSQNGKRLRGQDFTPEQWDKVMLPLVYFATVNKSNQLYDSDIKRLLSKLHISSSDRSFVSTCNYREFENWYKNYIEQVTNQKTEFLTVTYRTYRYEAGQLKPTEQAVPLSQLCR